MITLKKRTALLFPLMFSIVATTHAVDIKANIMMKGDLMRIEKEQKSGKIDYFYLMNSQANQIDNPGDGIELDLDGGLCGAHLALWYVSSKESGGENQWPAYFRRTYAWIKPVDSLTVRLGYVGNDTFFKEKIDQWKVGSPFAITERDWAKHPRYINCNDAEGWGFGLEYRPIDALVLNAGITPGAKGSVASNSYEDSAAIYNKDGDARTYIAPWGVGAKYYWKEFEFQASYRDGGMLSSTNEPTWSVARLGAGISNSTTHSFIQPILGFDWNSAEQKYEVNGMCLDLYSEVFYDAFTFMLHAPLTFRWSGKSDDISYMELNAKVKYNAGSFGNLDDVSPYVQFGSNQDDAVWDKAYTSAWILDRHFGGSFNMSYTLGVNFKVAAAEVDLGVKYDMFSVYHKQEYGRDYSISIPFMLKFRKF